MLSGGLSEKQVLELREKFGENLILSKEKTTWLSILLFQLKSPLIYILIVIGFISLFFKEYFDLILIWSVIVLNTLMGFFQEYHVKKTLAAFRKLLKPKALVVREGKRKEIEARELVPGDLVVLNSGDKVPADGKIIEGVNLLINEAILTGEEEAVAKTTEKENSLAFMGTMVISGRGIIKVLNIGKETAIGKIEQKLADIKERKTPIQLKLDEFSKSLGKIILIVCVIVFLVGLFYRVDAWEMFKFAVILAVAAIPEGLPIAITVILALGVRRVLKRNGLVKRLISVETLGSTSVICTDKTGTLTEGKMKVVKTDFLDKGKTLLALTLNNEQRSGLEAAIWDYVKKEKRFNPQDIFDKAERIYEEPFDSEKKYSMTINKVENKEIAFLKGAPEIILSFCQIFDEEKNKILREIEKWADEGLRILGVAFKEKGNLKEKKGFSWLGLVGIIDPIRKDVREAILSAQKAGIEIKIVTGDYRKTAERLAANLGFKLAPKNILEGQMLEAISEEELEKKIDDIVVFSRVAPHQKQKIVKVLQEKGEIVAMTGDGVNDVLALKKADIGVAVGSASEVAKEAGDLILLDNNFTTIVAAVEEGRLIFSNIKKVVSYVLSNSFVEIFLIFGSIILDLPYPLIIVQILWLHLICDGPPDIILGFEPKEKDLMKERPENLRKESILSNAMKFLIFGISFIIGFLCLFLFWYILEKTGDLIFARTIIFTTVAIVDLIYIFSFKNLKKPIFKTENFFKNKLLFLGVLYGLLLTFAAIYLPVLNRILGTEPLKPIHWLLVLSVALIATLWAELVKIVYNRKHRLNNN
ncbi:MAG: HAD-IC family P-type ATPase [Patescibacteria group bacterium]|nr:HAD-IC family P-type ATPase [Patescibacteria group bacterium]